MAKDNEKKTQLNLLDRIADALEDIDDVLEEGGGGGGGSGSGLPEVTSDDNGDVLTVVEGAWAKAAPSGGVLVITETDGTLDKTWQEIWDAGAGFIVFSASESEKSIKYIASIGVDNGEYFLMNSSQEQYTTNSADGYPVFDG